MDKQKKNKVLRVASLALVLTLMTTCLSAYTLAKYTTSVSGTDTARVAKFAFGALVATTDEDNNVTSAVALGGTAATALEVFSTSYVGTTGTIPTVLSTDKVIAPGVFGSFQYAFTGTSEVSLNISFDITETQTATDKVPMLYKYNNVYYSNQYAVDTYYFVLANDGSTIETVNVAGNLTALATAVSANIGVIDAGTDLSNAGLTAAQTTVTWYWPYEEYTDTAANGGTLITASDDYDTALGVEAATGTAATVTLKIAATATQVD